MREIAVFVVGERDPQQEERQQDDRRRRSPRFEETVGAGARRGDARARVRVDRVGLPLRGRRRPRSAPWPSRRSSLEMGCYQVSLGDTIGVGTPRQTERILRAMADEIAPERLAMHMHDTRGTALANVLVGLEMGIRDFDASVGGLGGCPYAPGRRGQPARPRISSSCSTGMGIETGIDLERLVEAGKVAESVVGRSLPWKGTSSGCSQSEGLTARRRPPCRHCGIAREGCLAR